MKTDIIDLQNKMKENPGTTEIFRDAIDEATKLGKGTALSIIEICVDSVLSKVVTTKRERNNTHIYIGGSYFGTLEGTQWEKINNLVIDSVEKAYKRGVLDTHNSIKHHVK